MWGVHDISDSNLCKLISSSKYPETLKTLVDISRKNFGFFNKTVSRSIEYPYIVKKIANIHGMHVLDVGAGVSPLPLYFALEGAKVVTVDNSETIRKLNSGTYDWNGWGFFDYNCLVKNISSLNADICEVTFKNETFDYVYSVSVIEHMHSQSRKKMWRSISSWVKDRGLLILTLDLIPKTELLWNYCEGNLVEEKDVHGDIQELVNELAEERFEIEENEILRLSKESMTDIALLSFRKKNS